MEKVNYLDLGLIDYQKAWDIQTSLFDEMVSTKLHNRANPDELLIQKHYFILCQHPHVYTLGRNGKEDNLLLNEDSLSAIQAEFVKINRGGDITYHGPGQIVGYPILDLDFFFTDIGRYIRLLEEMVILTLKDYGLEGGRISGQSGVWLDIDQPKVRKICAIGVHLSRWITMHGFAFNVNTDLDYFKNIIPCGISDKGVTSLQTELGRIIDLEEVEEKLLNNFAKLFQTDIIKVHKQ